MDFGFFCYFRWKQACNSGCECHSSSQDGSNESLGCAEVECHVDYVSTSCYHGDIDQYSSGRLEFSPFWWKKASERVLTLPVTAPAQRMMAQMKGELVLKSIDISIMLLRHVTMEILMKIVAAIFNFVRFRGKKASKKLVTLAVTAPAHHMMAQMKGELVLKSIDISIMLLRHVTMEILMKMVAAILNFLRFRGKKASKKLVTLSVTAPAHPKMAQMKGELVLKSTDIY